MKEKMGASQKKGKREDKDMRSYLAEKPNAQLLFVGAVSCARHRAFPKGDLMREKKLSILCPTAVDFATGRYLHQIVEASVEICRER